jgi:hypothetical protein
MPFSVPHPLYPPLLVKERGRIYKRGFASLWLFLFLKSDGSFGISISF